MDDDRPNVELDPELLSSAGLNPFIRGVSSSRAAMFTGNLSQMVVIKRPTRKRIMTGMERIFAEHSTSTIEFDDDVEIIKAIPRFGHTAGKNQIRKSPQTAVIYRNYNTGKIGVTMIRDYHVTHQHFGLEFKKNQDIISRLQPKARFPKGTRLAGSPLVDDDGNYMYGRETLVLMDSDVAGTEDGIKARRGYMECLAPTGFETHTFEFGKTHYPLKQNDDPNYYQIFPEIGDRVNSTNLLVALRKFDIINAVSNMTTEALQLPDYIFDRKRFIQHPDAEVVDIVVERNTSVNIPPLPVGMDEQLLKYYDADTEYYRKILEVYIELRDRARKLREELQLEEAFHTLVGRATARLGLDYVRPERRSGMSDNGDTRTNVVNRGVPIDAWHVTITVKYDSIPNQGYKITDINGDKSVVVEVVDDEDMPTDENGVVADIVVDKNSRWNRMTPASPNEMIVSASSRDLGKRIQQMFGWPLNGKIPFEEIEARVWAPENAGLVQEAWDTLLEYYKCVVPLQYDDMTNPEYQAMYPDFMHAHVTSVIHDHEYGLYLFFPPNNPVHIPTMLREIKKRWPPFITPVRFRGRDGKMKVSRKPKLIAPSYYITLEKTAEDGWMASSSAKRQIYGTTARVGKHDKYDAPGSTNPARVGESEFRLMAATQGGEETADFADASNDPVAHKAMQHAIYTAERPTDIPEVLDRDEHPRGQHRPLNFLRHLFECSGKELTDD